MKRSIMASAVAAGLLLAAGPALAQEGSAGTGAPPGASQSTVGRTSLDIAKLRAVDDKDMNVTYNGLSVSNMKGATVQGADGSKIGDIDKVLTDPDNKIVAVTVDAGGFLGIGAKEVVMPLDQMQYDAGKKQFTASIGKDDVKSMPEWKK